MIVRVYDVVVDNLQDGIATLSELKGDFRISVPDRDLNDVMERTENRADLVDAVSSLTGQDISSFSYEVVE